MSQFTGSQFATMVPYWYPQYNPILAMGPPNEQPDLMHTDWDFSTTFDPVEYEAEPTSEAVPNEDSMLQRLEKLEARLEEHESKSVKQRYSYRQQT